MAASPYLKKLWEREPFKPRWAIVGRAYTAVRDVSSKQALPLSVFLKTAAPLMGIIPVADYFAMMGWEISYTSKDTIELRQIEDPNPKSFPASIRTTAMTEHDLIRFCHSWKANVSSDMVTEALSLLSARRPQQALLAVADYQLPAACSKPSPELHRQQGRQRAKQKRMGRKLADEDKTQAGTSPCSEDSSFQMPWCGSMAELRLPAEETLSSAAVDTHYLDDLFGYTNITDPPGDFNFDPFLTETWSSANGPLL